MTTTTRKSIEWTPECPDTTGWKNRHLSAINRPHAFEKPVVGMLRSWLQYAEMHQQRYESNVGRDGVLGPEWAAIGAAIRGLLNGECGRLDCDTLDTIISDTLIAEGFDPDLL